MQESLLMLGTEPKPGKESTQPGDWYFHEGEWYYCAVDRAELRSICSPFLKDTNPNQIRTVTRSGQSHDIPLNNIDTRYVTDMREMFRDATNFNQNISNWNVSNVTHMASMFNGATNFNQNLSKWCVTNITRKPNFFDSSSGLTRSNLPIWGTCPNG